MAGVTLMLLTNQLFGPEWLAWDRTHLREGEYWRLFTGHWVHLNGRHLVLNVVGMWLLVLLYSREFGWRTWCLALTVLPLLISAGLWYGVPGLEGYVGLSGVLHGVYVAGAVYLLGSSEDRFMALMMLSLLGLKLWLERNGAEASPTAGFIGGRILVESHRFGALSGLVFGVLHRIMDRKQSSG